MGGRPTLADIVLAFRQAKKAIATERGGLGLFELAHFEMHLATRARRLRTLLKNDRWFDAVDIGRLVVMPKSAEPASPERPEIVRIGNASPARVNLRVRLQLEPSPEFTITEVLYLWEFGGVLEALLNDSCVGYRLKRVITDGVMDRHDREVYEYWPTAFERYRDDPIKAARAALLSGKDVVVTSTDIVSFFDSIDPQFLLQDAFVGELVSAASRRGRSFSLSRYRTATKSLLTKFSAFRLLRRSVGGTAVDVGIGVPIGALTSRVFANVALASVDTHIQRLQDVVLYRRYVDDIVIVSTRGAETAPPESRATVLGGIFPGFRAGKPNDRFIVPATGATFELKEEKTRVHYLTGRAGIDFLDAVKLSFSVVSSERRAFLGNFERLETEIEGVDLFGDEATGTNRIPRLRDADRFTLRRFIATAVVRGLERCALLLGPEEANEFLEQRTSRMLSILAGNPQLDDFELVVSLLKIALLSNSHTVAVQLRNWLEQRNKEVLDLVEEVSWRGQVLQRSRTLRRLQVYLARCVREGIASACPLPGSTPAVGHAKESRDGVLLRRTSLRHLDREDDVALFGNLDSELPRLTRLEHAAARKHLRVDRMVSARLVQIQSFLDRSDQLGERIWTGMSDVGLLLSVKPPRYVDVARRFLARAETGVVTSEVGRQIDACVDALRGTRYQRRHPVIGLETTELTSVLRVASTVEQVLVRVILSNLPIESAAFTAAANGQPVLTISRLRALDHALREAQRAAHEAKQQQKPSILLFPELSVPQRWTRALAEHAVREELSIVAGIEYESTARGLVNQALGVFPAGMHTAAIVRWTKRHPARVEEETLKALGKKLVSQKRPMRRLVVESAHGRIGVLICSELLQATALSELSGHVELLLVPAWNIDTPSFDHASHAAASLLVHSFVCVANNAIASDSRIVAPIKEPHHEREWCRLIHRGENQIIWGDLPIGDLRQFHDQTGRSDIGSPTGEQNNGRTYRLLPPGWNALW